MGDKMSDTTATPTDEVSEQPATGTESKPEMTAEERIEFLTAANRKLEDQVKGKSADPNKSVPYLQKQRDALQKELDAIKASQMTEQEKILARAEAAESRLKQIEAEAEQKALIEQVANEKGVPANALRGATQEELELHADLLLSLIPKVPAAPSADGQGNVGEPIGGGVPQLTQADLQRMAAAGDDEGITKAKAEGRLNDVLGIRTT